MRTVLITLIGPERTADLVVDADTAVDDLLPSLLNAGGVATDATETSSWGVALMGKQPLAGAQTLEQAGVLDGAVLVVRRDSDAPPERVAAPLPRSERSGSPLARTRELLATAAPSRGRARLLPDPNVVADGANAPLERAIAGASLDRCATIAVVSPKGGVGKTTISILLGELLQSLREQPVLALDADSDYGSLGRVGRTRDGSIFASLSEGAVTFAELDRTLWSLPGGLRVVPSPRDPAAMARADRTTYARVIGNLQRLAELLVIDCGTGLGQPGTQAAILACDQLVLVTDATGATASLAVEATELLERTGRPITIVGNRLRRGRQGTDDLARLDALFAGATGLIGISSDDDAELALRGEFVWQGTSRSLRRATVELAASLALAWPQLGFATN